MYEMKGRVRYSEVDAEERLTIQALINYLQDCSTFQSEDVGFPVRKLKQKDLGWYILSWQIDIDHLPILGENLIVTTSPSSYKGFYAYRDFTVHYPGEDPFIRVRSIWVLMNLKRLLPVKVPKEMLDAYGMEPPVPGDWNGRKLREPEHPEERGSFRVTGSYLDSNHHMNNEKYIEESVIYLPEDFQITGLRTEYRKQALLGETVYISTEETEDGMTAVLKNEKETLAVVRFLGHVESAEKGGTE